jgi:DNA polymerase III delta prime subunit
MIGEGNLKLTEPANIRKPEIAANNSSSRLAGNLPWDLQYSPLSLDQMVGHEAVVNLLRSIVSDLRASGGPRAFLLRGPGVTDPEWVAEAFIHEFIEGAGGGGAPDAILRMDGTLERDVDSVRRVEQFVLTRSMLSPVKAVEVFSVGSMTADAQRLLASLIAGCSQRRVTWMLTSDNYGEIVEELQSAAVILDLRPLSAEEIASRLLEILEQRGGLSCPGGGSLR